MAPAEKPCFFILGYGRSGTTLLRRMLSAHPQLFVAPESDIFQRFPQAMKGEIASISDIENILSRARPYYKDVYDFSEFKSAALAELPLSPADFFYLLINSARIGSNKPEAIWGHKMPSEWPYLPTWRTWFPNARFLHIVRHPQDAIASMVQYQLQRYPTTALVGAWQWRKTFEFLRSHGQSMGPNKYMLTKYEALVSGPEAVLNDACSFLGVNASYVGKMIDYKSDASAAHVDDGEHMQQTHKALTTERVGRSNATFTQKQMAVIDYILQHQMSALGYEPRSSLRLSPWKKAWIDLACRALDVGWFAVRATRRAKGQL
jgi:hypothetical protein